MADLPTTALYNIEITVPPNCGEHLTEDEVKEALYDISDLTATITVTRSQIVAGEAPG